MPTYYEGSVGSVKTQITREEFSQAWRLDQEKNGRLKNIGVKRRLRWRPFCLCLSGGFLFIPVILTRYGRRWCWRQAVVLRFFIMGFCCPIGSASRGKQVLIPKSCWANPAKSNCTATATDQEPLGNHFRPLDGSHRLYGNGGAVRGHRGLGPEPADHSQKEPGTRAGTGLPYPF